MKGIFTIILLIITSGLADVTRPPIVPASPGPPKDRLNCRVDFLSPLSWVISIWDSAEKIVVGHGSMLTYIAFVTTCRGYDKIASSYEAHAHDIWDPKNPTNPCMQSQKIETIIKHPNCAADTLEYSLFDISLFKLAKPFDIVETHYPAFSVPNDLYSMRMDVGYLNNITTQTRGCFLVSFSNQEDPIPIFNMKVDVQIIPFHDKCVKQLCEMDPADASKTEACTKQFADKENNTMFCVKNATGANIELGKGDSYWLRGAPLLCNGTTFGFAAKPKFRHKFTTDKEDFHYVLAFSRVYPWLLQNLQTYAPPWVKHVYIGNRDFKNEGDPTDPPESPPTLRSSTIWPTPPDLPSPLSGFASVVKSYLWTSICLVCTIQSF